jgi:hypothetical protein
LKERELHSKAIADAAITLGAHYIIFSTLPAPSKISDGKYCRVDSFDVKADIEVYIRSLLIRSAFFAPGAFIQNYGNLMAPQPADNGTYAICNVVKPQILLPHIDIVGDTGK